MGFEHNRPQVREKQNGQVQGLQLFQNVLETLLRRLDLVVEREPESGLRSLSPIEVCIQQVRNDESLNLKPEFRVVNVRRLRVLEDRLETDAELADRRLRLVGIGNGGDGIDVAQSTA